MRYKTAKIILAIFIIALAVLDVWVWRDLSYGNMSMSDSIVVPQVPDIAKSSMYVPEIVGLPLRLKIPSIALDAAIEKVALKTDGSMDVPKDPMNAGWYELGYRPGEMGSAVIDGHVDWWYGATGVFANLHKIKPGDKITVQDDAGLVFTFIVREIRTYNAAADATNIFISNDGIAHLNLITCTGAWNKNANQYSKRLVVFADKEL